MQFKIQRTSRFVMPAALCFVLALASARSSSAAPPGFELNPAPGVLNAPVRGQISVTFPAAVNSEPLSASGVYVYGSLRGRYPVRLQDIGNGLPSRHG